MPLQFDKLKATMLFEKFFSSKRKPALYALVITNCALFISYFGLRFFSNKASLFTSILAFLLAVLYFPLGFKAYRQSHDRETRLDKWSILVGLGFSGLFLFHLLTINWTTFQAGVVDILVLGGLCGFTKDYVLELMTIHTSARLNLQT